MPRTRSNNGKFIIYLILLFYIFSLNYLHYTPNNMNDDIIINDTRSKFKQLAFRTSKKANFAKSYKTQYIIIKEKKHFSDL